MRILHPEKAPPLLATLAQRLEGMEQLGLDAVLVMRFDAKLSLVAAEDFVRHVLAKNLRARLLRVGENFRFGHRHAGDVRLLRRLGGEFGFEVEIVPPVVLRGRVVSSTAIRQALREGRVTDAARLLGRPFALTGHICSGTGRGRRLVVPTLNLAPEQEILPRTGVYVTETVAAGRRYPSVTNVGIRPTFDGKTVSVESHLFEFSANVGAGRMEVHFWRRLRAEKKFRSPEALKVQIERDVRKARAFFDHMARAEQRENRRVLLKRKAPV
jgi:riboflavin kinase/FMN adenylyltransferase